MTPNFVWKKDSKYIFKTSMLYKHVLVAGARMGHMPDTTFGHHDLLRWSIFGFIYTNSIYLLSAYML